MGINNVVVISRQDVRELRGHQLQPPEKRPPAVRHRQGSVTTRPVVSVRYSFSLAAKRRTLSKLSHEPVHKAIPSPETPMQLIRLS